MLILVLVLALCVVRTEGVRLSEDERVKQWHARNNTWPPNWQPETEGFREFQRLRELELQRLPGADERWENYMQYTSARMVPRFTETGFELIDTPPHLQAKLKAAVDNALANWDKVREESVIEVLYTPTPSKFVDIPALAREVHRDLQQAHEDWAGLKLKPTSIYGIRMNRNGSSLVMHYDKIFTHVISSIIHIDHEYFDDSEPWPIEIEDHTGQIHLVNLEPGQVCCCYCCYCCYMYCYY